MDIHSAYSAVKIDVSDVSSSCDSKVLVLSHESSTRDVITSLLKKLKMRDYDSSSFVVEAEILAEQDVAILQFEDDDKLMQAYQQFPKGSMRLCMRYKSEFDMDIADEKREGKTGLNGHQLTLQRIRRSLEKLKRKSGTSASKQSSSSKAAEAPAQPPSQAPSTPRSARPPIKPQSPTAKVKSQGVSASTSVSTPRGQRSSADKPTTPSNGATDRRREYRNRTERSRRRSYAGDEHSGHKSPYSLASSKPLSYKPTTVPHGSSGAASDTECMIFYDSISDTGSVSHLPTHNAPVTSRSQVMPRHVEHQHNKQSVMIDKPMKMSFKNLEDSGIDVKSPPNSGKVRERVNSTGDMEYKRPTPSKPTTNGHSQESYVSPTLSESSPFSFMSANEGNHVKRTGSFSSLKSLPVTVFKEPGGSPFMFEPINQERLSRTKSQSMTNLHNNKVVRRRSLPPLDVSQEKLEQKKSSLSKRLAKKISNFRNNEKRYMLPSPHTFTSQNLQHYKAQDKTNRTVSDNTGKNATEVDNDDNVSLADMEVAHILEGKPEHPTDSDVEDYLACVESTNTTQSESQHAEYEQHLESTPYSQLDKYHAPKSSKAHSHTGHYVDHNSNSQKKYTTNLDQNKNNQKSYNDQNKLKSKTGSKYEIPEVTHSVKDKSHDIGKSMDSGIESAYSRTVHSKGTPNEKAKPVNTAPKPKKSLNKFVEQSMQSFLNDCHQGAPLTDSDILDMHHAALQNNMHSPHKENASSVKYGNQNVTSPLAQSKLNMELKSPVKVQPSFDPDANSLYVNRTPDNKHELSEYEQARARFAQMTSNAGNSDVTNGQHSSRTDTTYKSNIQLKLQTNNANKSSKDPLSPLSPRDGYPDMSGDTQQDSMRRRRSSQGSEHTVCSQSSKDKYKTGQSEEEWAGKPLTLFAIVRTHCVMSVLMEKGPSKSFGIKVKRVLFTSCGQIKDSSAGSNVVAIHEVSPSSPADVSTAVHPNDVIIEINGHNVLQSSDKVVKTLLDARSVLEVVIARDKKQITDSNIHETSVSKSPLVFHNMDEIFTDSQFKQEPSSGHLSARSKKYEHRSELYEYQQGAHEQRSVQYEQRLNSNEQRSHDHGVHEHRLSTHDPRSRQYEQAYGEPDAGHWNAKAAQYDSVITSPRFNQLSEGPTFLL